MKLTKSDYVLKLASATPLQLIIINYELVIDNIDEALQAIGTNGYKSRVKSAKAFLDELITGLDINRDLSKRLFQIYLYVSKLLIDAALKENSTALQESKKIMESLLDGWRQIEKYDSNTPLDKMPKTAGQVYAGLTYGKGGKLNEYIDSSDGYKA